VGSSGTQQQQQQQRIVLFYSRRSSRTMHGRIMEAAHEQELLEVVRSSMKRWKRPEQLVVFNGEDEGG
jgi:hypothetical protein